MQLLPVFEHNGISKGNATTKEHIIPPLGPLAPPFPGFGHMVVIDFFLLFGGRVSFFF